MRNAEKSEGTPKNYSGALKTFDSLKNCMSARKISRNAEKSGRTLKNSLGALKTRESPKNL
ncbi:hypothetical protein GCM10010978_28270 [Compostibacillus humi]|uniref:Uncharacterized protein n=1 Tax=Compostibacillus humi TaxID=1245525 RepID=A0A8J2TT40_9BACI|nr:hypothetical protein GCM10010978_28270 [Compostibacillus humi]